MWRELMDQKREEITKAQLDTVLKDTLFFKCKITFMKLKVIIFQASVIQDKGTDY